MKCWQHDPLEINWLSISKQEKKEFIQNMEKEDIAFLKEMREIFNSVTLQIEVIK